MTDWPAPAISDPGVMKNDGTAAMVVGIIGTVYGLMFGWLFPLPALILGIIGLVLYGNATRNGKATAGLVLSIINTSLAGLWMLFWIVVISLS